MDTIDHSKTAKTYNIRTVAGILLLLAGGILFLDRFLKTGWLSLFVLPSVGLFLYFWGVRQRHFGLILAGGLLGAIGLGSMVAWGPAVRLGSLERVELAIVPHTLLMQVGTLALFTGVGMVGIAVTAVAIKIRPTWWALLPGGVLTALGICLLFSPVRWTDFVLYGALGIGIPLLLWGLLAHLIGLVIPGCLLLGAGPGIYLAWRMPASGNGLTQTGIMLVWIAFGWMLISVAARRVTPKPVWWPLIPGGILAVVGTGLYIGGDPAHAIGFIGNTGSIALMIFGLYLLLMRKGIHH